MNPVVCMDETPRQLIRETRMPLPPRPGRLERHDYEYEPCGVCNVFMASEPLAGTRMTKVTERTTKIDWAQFLRDIAERYADAERITLVMDNLKTHRPGDLYEAFPPDPAAFMDEPGGQTSFDLLFSGPGTPQAVPAPGSLALLLGGIAAIGLARRRRRTAAAD